MSGSDLIIFAIYAVIATFFIMAALLLEDKLLRFSRFLNGKFWEWITRLPRALYRVTLKRLFAFLGSKLHLERLEPLDDRLEKFGGLKRVTLGSIALIFILVEVIIDYMALQEIGLNLLYSTAIGAPFSLVIDGVSFSLATLIGAAFTRYLSMLATRRKARKPVKHDAGEKLPMPIDSDEEPPEVIHPVLKWTYAGIFLGAFALLGSVMGGIFTVISTFLEKTFDGLTSMNGIDGAPGFVNVILFCLVLIAVAIAVYLWLLLAIMMLKEYLSSLCFGLVPLTVLLFVIPVLNEFGLGNSLWVFIPLFIVAIFFGEWNRHRLENLSDEALETEMNKRRDAFYKCFPFMRGLVRKLGIRSFLPSQRTSTSSNASASTRHRSGPF